jgi:hypothetical protein
MHCGHTGFHSITSRYDRERETLVYLRVCERCGTAVSEVERVSYRPRFQAMPHGGYVRGSSASALEASDPVE